MRIDFEIITFTFEAIFSIRRVKFWQEHLVHAYPFFKILIFPWSMIKLGTNPSNFLTLPWILYYRYCHNARLPLKKYVHKACLIVSSLNLFVSAFHIVFVHVWSFYLKWALIVWMAMTYQILPSFQTCIHLTLSKILKQYNTAIL